MHRLQRQGVRRRKARGGGREGGRARAAGGRERGRTAAQAGGERYQRASICEGSPSSRAEERRKAAGRRVAKRKADAMRSSADLAAADGRRGAAAGHHPHRQAAVETSPAPAARVRSAGCGGAGMWSLRSGVALHRGGKMWRRIGGGVLISKRRRWPGGREHVDQPIGGGCRSPYLLPSVLR